ncbi:MAG: hypothetical protein E6J20_10110 [Chloroflexi bacterium]|nr:MAG: hypothetical protein E6J20_10110 [Chloroflexota bacterium]
MDRSQARQRLILHPSINGYFNKWVRNLGLPFVVIAVIALIYRWATIPGARTTVFATIVGLVLIGVAFFGRAEISVDDGVLTYRRFLWGRRFRLESIGGLALRRLGLRWNSYARSPAPYAVVYARDGRALFSLSAALWSDRDLRNLQEVIGGDSSDAPLSASELQSEFPGALPGWLLFLEGHPVWTIVIGAPLALVVVIVAIALWDLVKPR